MVPVIGETTKISFAGLSFVITLGILAFIVAAPLWGRLSDRKGRRRVMLCGCAGSAIGHGGVAFSIELAAQGWVGADSAFYLLTLFRLIYGFSAAAVFPIAQAWIADCYDETDLMPKLGFLRTALTIGRFAGPPVAAGLIVLAPLAPLHFLVVFALIALYAVWRSPEPPPVQPERAGNDRALPGRFPDPAFACLLLIVLLLSLAVGQLQFTIGLHAQARFGLSAASASQFVGLLLTAAALAALAVQVLVIRRLQGHAAVALACAAATVGGAVALVFWGDAQWTFLLGAVLAGAAVAVALPACAAMIAAGHARSRLGRLMGAFGSAQTLGYALGAALGGLYSTAPAASFGLAILAPLLAVVFVLASRGLKPEAASLKPDGFADDNRPIRNVR